MNNRHLCKLFDHDPLPEAEVPSTLWTLALIFNRPLPSCVDNISNNSNAHKNDNPALKMFVVTMVTASYSHTSFFHKLNLAGQNVTQVVCNSSCNGNTCKAQSYFTEASENHFHFVLKCHGNPLLSTLESSRN